MPIALQDAIERTKLSADESGYISQYTFDEMLQALAETDKHAFVTALADLGILTKYSSIDSSDIEHMQDVIAHRDKPEVVDIVDDFLKAAQKLRTPVDESDIYEGLDIDFDEDEEALNQTNQTNMNWPPEQAEPAPGDPNAPLWPSAPGQVYTDPSQTQQEYDPDMDLSIDPYGEAAEGDIGLEHTVQQEVVWPSMPGQVYTDSSQTELEYDPDMDLSLDPYGEAAEGDISLEKTIPGKKIRSTEEQLLRVAQAVLEPMPLTEGAPGDEAMFEGIDDSLYREFLAEEPEVTPPPLPEDPGYEVLEERSVGEPPPLPSKPEATPDPGYEILEEKDISEADKPSEQPSNEEAVDFLAQHNIQVNPDDTVTFHQGTSGIGGEGVSNLDYLVDPQEVMAMPFEKAVKLFEQKQKGAEKEMGRISKFQDTLVNFTKTLGNMDNEIFTTLDQLDAALESLGKFKYNEQSPDSGISQIAKSLEGIKGQIQEKMMILEDFSSGAWTEYIEPVKNLQGQLDAYAETQYNKIQENQEIVTALQSLGGKSSKAPEESEGSEEKEKSAAEFLGWRN